VLANGFTQRPAVFGNGRHAPIRKQAGRAVTINYSLCFGLPSSCGGRKKCLCFRKARGGQPLSNQVCDTAFAMRKNPVVRINGRKIIWKNLLKIGAHQRCSWQELFWR
jgi:hypothetical protein